jgi:hypothetical protein
MPSYTRIGSDTCFGALLRDALNREEPLAQAFAKGLGQVAEAADRIDLRDSQSAEA